MPQNSRSAHSTLQYRGQSELRYRIPNAEPAEVVMTFEAINRLMSEGAPGSRLKEFSYDGTNLTVTLTDEPTDAELTNLLRKS